ncbi:MAG: YebC/PmpR family DNA-binding transcriptional regulator [Patescibacteria group bacterium]|jgi:YebC/PmpR family DNA-binding regulatory protein
MSGHSKWATIHRQKESSDQKRGQIFTKISNAIIIAVREGGGIADPQSNFKLRLILEKARAANMPKDNIQRAIDRALGKGGGETVSEVTYEGYGPGGVGVLVETMTDNKQRTVQEVKNVFDRSGGSIASPGSVAFNFKKTGYITVGVAGDPDEAILKLIDLGAEDVELAEDGFLEVYCQVENLESLKENIALAGMEVKSAEIIMKPVNLISVTDPKVAGQVLGLMDKLDALDDVHKVYANFDIPEEVLKQISA